MFQSGWNHQLDYLLLLMNYSVVKLQRYVHFFHQLLHQGQNDPIWLEHMFEMGGWSHQLWRSHEATTKTFCSGNRWGGPHCPLRLSTTLLPSQTATQQKTGPPKQHSFATLGVADIPQKCQKVTPQKRDPYSYQATFLVPPFFRVHPLRLRLAARLSDVFVLATRECTVEVALG